MYFYTLVNEYGKFVVPAFSDTFNNGGEPKFTITGKPCILELFYDTPEKIKEFLWPDYNSLDWGNVKIQKIEIQFVH